MKNVLKTVWKSIASRIWLIVTPIVLALVIIVNCIASITYYEAICTVLGRSSVKLTGEEVTSYEKDFDSKKAAYENGNEVSRQICEEGFTLLKNLNGALPLAKTLTKASVFGKNSVNISTAGSGSAGKAAADTDIFKSLTDAGFTYNQALVDFYKDDAKSGSGRTTNPDDLDSGKEVTLSEGETPLSSYTEALWSSCSDYSDLAVIVITRIGGEGFDLPRSTDGTHFLQLQTNEKALIDKVTSMSFKNVVLVLNTATTMELGEVENNDGVDAILWTGYAGGNGMAAFGEILRGETAEGVKFSPSGKTVDTYAADFTHSPVWENVGASLGGDAYTTSTTNLITHQTVINNEAVYFVDYEEGIYVGYRYWETAYAEAQAGNYNFDYDSEVVYPFGFGLSYTSFSWTLENADELNGAVLSKETSLTFKVKVTNTGDYPGREVVQLYVTPPYTKGGIEKSAKNLIGFAKTDLLQPGENGTVEITVDSPYAFASYDYTDANKNGFKGYEIEKGEYTFALSSDAHTSVIDVTASVAEDIKYETDPVTGEKVENLYTDNADETLNSDTELGSVLSRADFAATWPARRTDAEKNRNDAKDWLTEMQGSASNPNRPEKSDVMPATGVNNGVSFSDLVGLDYDDPLWAEFMEQLTLKEMTSLINNGAFHSEDIARLGVPPTTSSDGAFGYVNFMGDPTVYGTCVYPCGVVVASTWNTDRVYDFGKAIGNEGLIGNESGNGAPYTGIYAPGLNIHRSPFGGRNCEYYSEDGFVSGIMAAAYAEGAASKGVYVTFKHFALNDQETHRSVSGLLTWATEQSMREIYLKAFEVAVKTAKADGVKAMGVMSSFNRIGMRWTGGDYRLLTTILREEWGYQGLVISDFNTCSYMVEKDMFYAGGDMDLQILDIQWSPDKNNATDVTVTRDAAKNILYVVANTNAVRGSFKIVIPTWQTVMFVIDAVVIAGLAVWGALVIIRAIKKGNKVTAAETEEENSPDLQ